MRAIGIQHPTATAQVFPDTQQTFLMTGGSSAQASDWATSTGAVANAAAAGVGIVMITALTTAGAIAGVFVNLMSTGAAVAAAGTSIASSGVSVPVLGSRQFQVPGSSTGFSIASHSSANVTVEMWKK